jgi:membrane fusion protein (multidrug efflux system)
MGRGSSVLLVALLVLAGAAAWLILGGEEQSGGRGFGGRAVTVGVMPVETRTFNDIVEALGSARASESVVVTSSVSDMVQKIHFEDGQRVNKGDLLVELVSVEEGAQLREAEANVLESQQQFIRIQELVDRGSSSGAALDAQQRSVDEAQSRLDALKARLADRQIRAPFAGVLGLRQISEGSLISPSTVITTLDAIDIINFDFSVPEKFLATLGAGQPVQATVEAYPGRVFDAKVKSVDSRVDQATRSVIVRAEMENSDNAIIPGMLVAVKVVSREWQGLSIPEEAVVPTGGRNFVFVVSGEESIRKEVELGIRRPGYVEVLSGLSEGEQVVTEGTMRLGRSGIKVRVLDREGAGA